jgi:flagellar assembly protein FliH
MSTNAQPRKFTFDQRFDAGPAGTRAAAPKAKKFYTPEEVEDVRAKAYAEGKGSLEAVTAQAQSMALGRIAEAAMTALNTMVSLAAEARAEALQVGLLAARRIAESALARYPLDAVEETIAHCLAQAAHEPRVVIKVSADVADALKARIGQLAEGIGFAGRIIIAGEPRLNHADCRLEWTDGGVERDAGAIGDRIEAVLARFIDSERRRAEDSIGA